MQTLVIHRLNKAKRKMLQIQSSTNPFQPQRDGNKKLARLGVKRDKVTLKMIIKPSMPCCYLG